MVTFRLDEQFAMGSDRFNHRCRPTLPPFTKTHGPWITVVAEASPLDFFSLFDDSVLNLLLEETNRLVENK